MLSTRRYFLGFFGLLCISLTSGCGEGAHEVKGKVTLDGEPVAGANVTFTKADNSITAGAMTSADGTFTVSRLGEGGLPEGDYNVFVSKFEGGGTGDTSPETDPDDLYKMMQDQNKNAPKELVPAKYNDRANPQLKITVPTSDDQVLLELKK